MPVSSRGGDKKSGVGTNSFKKGEKAEVVEDNIPMPPPPPVTEVDGVEDVEPGPVEEYLAAKENAEKGVVNDEKEITEGGSAEHVKVAGLSAGKNGDTPENTPEVSESEGEVDGEPGQDVEAEEEGGDDEPPEADDNTGSGETADEGGEAGTKKITRRNWSGMDDTQRRQFLSEKITGLKGKASDIGFSIQLVPNILGVDPQDRARNHIKDSIASAVAALEGIEDIEAGSSEDMYTEDDIRALTVPELGKILAGSSSA